MTREELKSADTRSLISALQYCGRDSYYATYYDEVVDEITKRLNRIAELEAQIEKMKSALIDIKSNTDDVNIEWQIKYLFDELEIKEK